MRRKGGGGWKVALGVFCAAAVSAGAWAQWQIGEQVLSPPLRGLYYSMRLGTNAPPLPFLPCDVLVYFLGTRPGSTNLVFAFDDRDQSREGREGAQTSGNEPPPLPDDNGGGSGGGITLLSNPLPMVAQDRPASSGSFLAQPSATM